MDVYLERPKLPFGEKNEYQRLTKTIESKFHFHEKGWSSVSLFFTRDGYCSEERFFDINIFAPDKSKLTVRQDIQIKMINRSMLADFVRGKGILKYDIENGSKFIFDLSVFPENDKQKDTPETHKTNVKEEKEDAGEDEEDEEEKIKIPKTMRLDAETKSKPPKYIELDFKRDKNGDIEKEIVNGISRPTACIVRLCSVNPNDGLVFADECIFGKHRDCLRKIMVAPANGYKKEYDFKLKSHENSCIFLYLKCGDHYGKAMLMLAPVFFETSNGKLNRFRMEADLFLNKKSNDRNVLSN